MTKPRPWPSAIASLAALVTLVASGLLPCACAEKAAAQAGHASSSTAAGSAHCAAPAPETSSFASAGCACPCMTTVAPSANGLVTPKVLPSSGATPGPSGFLVRAADLRPDRRIEPARPPAPPPPLPSVLRL